MKRLPMEDTPINFSNFHPAPGRRLLERLASIGYYENGSLVFLHFLDHLHFTSLPVRPR